MVTLNFSKPIETERTPYLSIESMAGVKSPTNLSIQDPLTASIQISDFSFHIPTGKYLAKNYPSAVKFFTLKTLDLVIYMGDQDWISKSAFPQTMSIDGDLNKAETTIMWRLDDKSYFSMISNLIYQGITPHLHLVLDCDDGFFNQFNEQNRKEVELKKISLSFE
jgi:hypothetical protein